MSRKHANAFSHQPGRQGGYVSGLTSFSDNMERGSAQTDLQNKELDSAGRAAPQEERRTGLASRPAKARTGPTRVRAGFETWQTPAARGKAARLVRQL